MVNAFVGYDANKHRRPADFSTALEDPDDPDLEPITRDYYRQWLMPSRPPAGHVPFSLNSSITSFDEQYGVFAAMEYGDGRKYVRHPDGQTYRLLGLSEMRALQPFAPASRLAVELAKPNHNRAIISQPDMLVLDKRSPSPLPAGSCVPIVVLTPENLLLASKLFNAMSIYLIEDVMSYGANHMAQLSRISPCLTWKARWEVAIFKLAPDGGCLEDIRSGMHDALASAVAPSSGVDGLVPKSLARICWDGRLSLHEFIVLLRAHPEMIDNLKLVNSLVVEIKFVEQDGETYNSNLLAKFIGGWLFSAVGSDSAAAGKRRLHDPPGTHGYFALVPMTGRKPFERFKYLVDTGKYTVFGSAARYTSGGSYAGGGAFPYPEDLGSPRLGHQWVYSLIDEKYVEIPTVSAGELACAPQDTPYALQAKVAQTSKPTLSRFLFGVGRPWTDGRESRRARLSDAVIDGPGGIGAVGHGGAQQPAPAAAADEADSDDSEEEPEPTELDPTLGAQSVVGDRLRAKDSYGKWCASRVEAVRGDAGARELRVHFMGWNKKWDEWVRVGSGRLAPALVM